MLLALAGACCALALAVALALTPGAGATVVSGSAAFPYEGGQARQFTVPAGVYYLTVQAVGGWGGSVTGNIASGGAPGGVETVLPVEPGDQLSVTVGGYGGNDGAPGWASGGAHGKAWGPGSGHTGAGGGGATGIVTLHGTDQEVDVVAGGGGGGGGDDKEQAWGGKGGNGGIDAQAGFPGHREGARLNTEGRAGGCGGCRSSAAGAGGEGTGFGAFAGGAGGGGGGGFKGGSGGDNGVYRADQVDPIGGSGGGGGSSWVTEAGLLPRYSVGPGPCVGGDQSGCNGSVGFSWGAPPTNLRISSGNGGQATVTQQFGSLAVLVTDARGIPVPGVPVTFTLPSTGPTGDFPGGARTATVESGDRGIATTPALSADRTAGAWTAEARVEAVPTPVQFALTNLPAATSTVLTTAPNPSYYGEPLTVAATVASALPTLPPTGAVQFLVDGSPVGDPVPVGADRRAELPAADLPQLGVGLHQIGATYLGDSGHARSSGSRAQQVEAVATSLHLASTPNPSAAGQPVTVTAQLRFDPSLGGVPSGTVTLTTAGGDLLGNAEIDSAGEAPIAIEALPLGSTELLGSYSGDSHFAPAQGSLTQSVGPEATATQLSSSVNPATYGALPTWTATVRRNDQGAALTGTISFSLDGATVCPAAPVDGSGSVTCRPGQPPPAGGHALRAEYTPPEGSGDEASRGTLLQTIVPARSLAAAAAQPEPSIFGAPVGLTATIGVPGLPAAPVAGTVQFSVDGRALGAPVAVTSGAARRQDTCTAGADACPFAAGRHAAEAQFASSDPSVSPSHAIVVHRVDAAPSQVSLSSSAALPAAGRPVTFTAAVGTAPGAGTTYGQVQFLLDGQALGEPVALLAGRATSLPVTTMLRGRHTVLVRYLGTPSYAPAEATLTQEVGRRDRDLGAPVVQIEGDRARVDRHGRLRIRARCFGEEGARCDGRIVLRSARPVWLTGRGGRGRVGGRAGIALGLRDVSLRAGRAGTVTLALNNRGIRVVNAMSKAPLEARLRPQSGTAPMEPHRLGLAKASAPAVAIGATRLGAAGNPAVRLSCGAPRGQHCRARLRLWLGGRLAAERLAWLAGGRRSSVRLRLRSWAHRALAARHDPVRALLQVDSRIKAGVDRSSHRVVEIE